MPQLESYASRITISALGIGFGLISHNMGWVDLANIPLIGSLSISSIYPSPDGGVPITVERLPCVCKNVPLEVKSNVHCMCGSVYLPVEPHLSGLCDPSLAASMALQVESALGAIPVEHRLSGLCNPSPSVSAIVTPVELSWDLWDPLYKSEIGSPLSHKYKSEIGSPLSTSSELGDTSAEMLDLSGVELSWDYRDLLQYKREGSLVGIGDLAKNKLVF